MDATESQNRRASVDSILNPVVPDSPSSPPLAVVSALPSEPSSPCPIVEWRWTAPPGGSRPSSPQPQPQPQAQRQTQPQVQVQVQKQVAKTVAKNEPLKVAAKPIAKRRQRPRQFVFFSTNLDPVSGKFSTRAVPEPFAISFHMVQPDIHS